MAVRFFTRVLPTVAVGTVSFTIYSATADAFFPPIPIGSQTVVTPPSPVSPVVVVPPTVSPEVPVPPLPPPPYEPPPPPPYVPPVVCNCEPAPPCGVPEPATIISGVLGLGAVAGAALRKKLTKPAGDAAA